MSSKRTKKQQRELEDGLKGFILLVAGASYLRTKSFLVTGIFVGIAIILIIAIAGYQKKKRKERLRNSGIEAIDSMDGIQFEYYLKELYLSKGFAAEVTSSNGDYGADLLLIKGEKRLSFKQNGIQRMWGLRRFKK